MRPRTGDWQSAFLATLGINANVAGACRAAGVSRQAAYAARARHAGFREQWDGDLQDPLIGRITRPGLHSQHGAAAATGRWPHLHAPVDSFLGQQRAMMARMPGLTAAPTGLAITTRR